MSKYLDLRQEFWRDAFGAALPYQQYLNASPENHRAKWQEMQTRITVPDAQKDIVTQFVTEALGLSLAGGLLGIGLGFAISRLVAAYSGWITIITAASRMTCW